MKLNNLLSLYFSKSLLKNLMFCLFISSFFIFLIDLVELSRRITKSNNSDFLLALELAVLKLPGMIIEIFPFIVLFASLSTFFYFAKRSELIVARSSGLSIWHLLIPGISLILIIGFFTVILIQPFIATSSYKFKELEAKTIRGQTSLITITENGLWLKDTDINSIDALITNFHLPKSSLFILICALMGTNRMIKAYEYAIKNNYRFYSYGDACLLEK